MPTYEYQCKGCEHRFDEMQSFNDPVLTKCPKCKKKKLQRLISGGAGFIVRGGTGAFGGRVIPMDSAEQKLAERMAELSGEQ